MPALPTPGGSPDTWGTELNDFLEVVHQADGTVNAEDITVVDSAGNFTGTDVEAVLAELQDNIDAGGGGGGLFDAFAHLREEQASGTNGGTFTSGAWQTRVLNTEKSDPSGIVSLSSNQFTLGAGTYLIKARAPAFDCLAHKTKIVNVTDGVDVLVGSSEWADTTGHANNDSVIEGLVTIAAAKDFELQHRCGVTKVTTGLGVATSFGVVEVFAEVWIYRLS